MQRIKLCLVTKWFHPVLAGGAERFRRYAPGLRERGIDLEVFTIRNPQDAALSEYEVLEGVPITRLSFPSASTDYPQFVHSVWQHIQARAEKPDVIQLFSVSPRMTPDLFRLRSLGIRIAYVGTMVSEEVPKKGLVALKNRLYTQVSMWGIDQIVASTEVMKASLISKGLSSKRIAIIPNGIDTKRFRPPVSLDEKRSIRQKLGINENGQMIVFVGNIIYRKGVDLLIKSWPDIISRHSSARLVLVGPYGDQGAILLRETQLDALKFYEQLVLMAEGKPGQDRIFFTGEVGNVEEYLRAADIFVFPSRQEGMGNVVLEAMSTGLPCILTPYVGFPSHEFGTPAHDFMLLSDHEPKGIAAAVNSLLQHEMQANAMGQSARVWVESHMDVEQILDQFETVYRGLLS